MSTHHESDESPQPARTPRRRGRPRAGASSSSPDPASATIAGAKHREPRLWQDAPLLTAAQERDLARRCQAGDTAARERLILSNLRLVVKMAHRYRARGATLDDLIQEGVSGLIHAVGLYDPERFNARFSTYASYWIRNALQRSLAATSSLIRMPNYLYFLRSRVERALSQDQVPDARSGTDDLDELAARLNTPKRQLQAVLRAAPEQERYCPADPSGGEYSREEEIADPYCPERELERAEEIYEVRRALCGLSPFEDWLIRRRFGLAALPGGRAAALGPAAAAADQAAAETEDEPMALATLAGILGVSLTRLRKVEQNALAKLRRQLRPRLHGRAG